MLAGNDLIFFSGRPGFVSQIIVNHFPIEWTRKISIQAKKSASLGLYFVYFFVFYSLFNQVPTYWRTWDQLRLTVLSSFKIEKVFTYMLLSKYIHVVRPYLGLVSAP